MPIVFDKVTMRFGALEVLRDACIEIVDGTMTALVGPSGAGKTTCLQLIGGLLKPTSGQITGVPDRGEIRWIFQTPTVLGRRSALDNVRIAIPSAGSEAELRQAAVDSLTAVGLKDKVHQRASTLSGGELQRVQIARATSARPPLILADEPTGQLDWRSAQSVIDVLQSMKRANSTIVIATHDSRVADECDVQLTVSDGSIRVAP